MNLKEKTGLLIFMTGLVGAAVFIREESPLPSIIFNIALIVGGALLFLWDNIR